MWYSTWNPKYSIQRPHSFLSVYNVLKLSLIRQRYAGFKTLNCSNQLRMRFFLITALDNKQNEKKTLMVSMIVAKTVSWKSRQSPTYMHKSL